jgi:hypothetical protein
MGFAFSAVEMQKVLKRGGCKEEQRNPVTFRKKVVPAAGTLCMPWHHYKIFVESSATRCRISAKRLCLTNHGIAFLSALAPCNGNANIRKHRDPEAYQAVQGHPSGCRPDTAAGHSGVSRIL